MDAEKALMARVQNGDMAAFDHLVDRMAPRLLRFCMARGWQHADAEDIVQDTFMRAFSARERYKNKYAVSTWLFTICQRLSINARAKKRAIVDVELCHMAQADNDEESPHEVGALWQCARESLSASQFDFLWLFYGENMSVKELAHVMGKTQVAAKVGLHRARKSLEKSIQSRCQEAPDSALAQMVAGGGGVLL